MSDWNIESKNEGDVIGSWVSKEMVFNENGKDIVGKVQIAAFIQEKIPACGIYINEKSKLFLVLQDDGTVSIQYEADDGKFYTFDSKSLEKMIKVQEILRQGA